MRVLQAPTEQFIKTEVGELAADAVAGSNVTLSLVNNNGIANAAFIAIGYEGNELCELGQVNQAISGNTSVRVATLKFNHAKGEPITVYRYDKRKFYGATSSTGSFAELTADGSPVLVQVDDPMGTSLEYTGNEGYTYFKATYFNSTTSEETDDDDAEAVLADESLRYASIYAIRKHAGLAGNPRYSDARLEVKRKQAENEMNSTLAAKYVLPLTEVPPLLGQICELLAAGYIDYEEFGKDGEGVKWLGEARALIKSIQKGTQILIGADGTELERNAKVGVLNGYPDDENTDCAQFSMSKKF